MYTSVSGVYRNGHVELAERPEHVSDGTQVIITFLNENDLDLRAHGIDEAQASELRSRLTPFAEDWNSSEMMIYDGYDVAKSTR